MTGHWFAQLPGTWATRRVKTLTPVLRGSSPRPIEDPIYFDDDGEFAWVRISDMSAAKGRLDETELRLSSLGMAESTKVPPGTLILSVAGTVGKSCITGIKACINDGLVYFPGIAEESKKYLYWIFESGQCFQGVGSLGTQFNLSTEDVGDITIPFPPVAIQQAIANYLDREIKLIDTLIETRQRLVTLAQEKRQALISGAVTGHINPQTGEVRDTMQQGSGFTGAFPASKCKRHLDILIGKMLQPTPLSKEDVLRPYIRSTNVQWGKLDISDVKDMWFQPAEVERYRIRRGDMLVIEGGQAGRSAIADRTVEHMGFQNSIHRVRARDGNDIRFVYYWMCHLNDRGYIDLACPKTTYAHFTSEKFAETPYPMVDLDTQRQIADFLDERTASIDELVTKTEIAIKLLRERRTAIITAAVTGQMDVSRETEWQPTEAHDELLERKVAEERPR